MSQVFISAQDSIINNLVYGCLLFVFQLRRKTWTATNVTEIVRGSSWGQNHTYFCSFNKTHYKSRVHLEETIKPYKLYPYSSLTQWNFLYHIATRVTSFLFKTSHAASKEDRQVCPWQQQWVREGQTCIGSASSWHKSVTAGHFGSLSVDVLGELMWSLYPLNPLLVCGPSWL